MKARFLTCDVFTNRVFGGNQLAVFPDAREIAPELMAPIAKEFNYSEMADLFMPVFSGHLVDALTRGARDADARHAAFAAFGAIVALGLTSMILRLIGLQAIVPFTLKIMSDIARDAFTACSASRPTGTPTPLPARPCARSRAACGRSTCSTTPC